MSSHSDSGVGTNIPASNDPDSDELDAMNWATSGLSSLNLGQESSEKHKSKCKYM